MNASQAARARFGVACAFGKNVFAFSERATRATGAQVRQRLHHHAAHFAAAGLAPEDCQWLAALENDADAFRSARSAHEPTARRFATLQGHVCGQMVRHGVQMADLAASELLSGEPRIASAAALSNFHYFRGEFLHGFCRDFPLHEIPNHGHVLVLGAAAATGDGVADVMPQWLARYCADRPALSPGLAAMHRALTTAGWIRKARVVPLRNAQRGIEFLRALGGLIPKNLDLFDGLSTLDWGPWHRKKSVLGTLRSCAMWSERWRGNKYSALCHPFGNRTGRLDYRMRRMRAGEKSVHALQQEWMTIQRLLVEMEICRQIVGTPRWFQRIVARPFADQPDFVQRSRTYLTVRSSQTPKNLASILELTLGHSLPPLLTLRRKDLRPSPHASAAACAAR